MKVFETTITRKTEKEGLQAISDLLKRGYTISYPLTEHKKHIESKGAFDYKKNRYGFNQMTIASCWKAKMRKEDES